MKTKKLIMKKKRNSDQINNQVRKKQKFSPKSSPNKSAKGRTFFRKHFVDFNYHVANTPLMNSARFNLPDGSKFPEPFVLKNSADDSKTKRRDLAVVSNDNIMFTVAYISHLRITQLQYVFLFLINLFFFYL